VRNSQASEYATGPDWAKKFQSLGFYVTDLDESAEVAVGCNDPLMPGSDLIG
jgi:hypothetical protein